MIAAVRSASAARNKTRLTADVGQDARFSHQGNTWQHLGGVGVLLSYAGKRRPAALAVPVHSWVPPAGHANVDSVETRDEAEVLAANDAYYAAFARLDQDGMARIWSARAPVTCIHPGAPLIVGRDAVLASWRSLFTSTRYIRFALREQRVFVFGTCAWVFLVEEIETDQGPTSARTGQRVQAETRSTNVFVREEGVWKLVHHHAEPATGRRSPPPKPGALN